MEFLHWRHTLLLRNLLLRALIIAVTVFLFRFAYTVAIRGDSCDFGGSFCFFSSSSEENLFTVTGDDRLQIPATKSLLSASQSPDFHANDSIHLFYSSVFLDLISDGFLSPSSKSLCFDSSSELAVLALKGIGVEHAAATTTPEKYLNNEFDFIFSGVGGLQISKRPFDLISAISTALKPEGIIVVQTTSFDSYSLNSLNDLFYCCSYIRSKKMKGYDSSVPHIREVVFKKEFGLRIFPQPKSSTGECSAAGYRREIVENAEPLIKEEPMKPWITLKKNMVKMKYLPSMVDISFKNRYIYIDVGARSYGSSIGSWFKKQYPKQGKDFEVYAIEADRVFHEQYKGRNGVTLVPYAAWVRNESLVFEVGGGEEGEQEGKKRGMGRILPAGVLSSNGGGNLEKIDGFDFAEWVKRRVRESDYVVMKMDVEGIEFEIIERMMESGAMCLVDEVFLECHYNRWQRCCPGVRSSKYERTYAQCLHLFESLRRSGVLVHQWW